MVKAPYGVPVLVVDDDGDLRDTLRMALEDEGYRVLDASDGAAALDQMRTHPTSLVVLLDWRMPSMDGIQLLEAIAADAALARRHAYILMTAAAHIPPPYWQVLPDDCIALTLMKPFELEHVFALIMQAAGRLPLDTARHKR